MLKSYLTTFDNPYDPSTQFDSWYMFDVENGYNSCSLIGRIAETSPAMSDQENIEETNRAIDEIIKNDFRNVYKRVQKEISI